MKKTIALAVIAASAGLASADTMVIDVSGTQFFDEQGSAVNTILAIAVGNGVDIASITNIAWDVNLTTFTDPNATFPSWASEATMSFEGAENVNVSGDGFGVVNQNYVGSQASSLVLGVDGILDIEFFESFDDSTGNADSAFEAGSTITLSGSNFVPTPGSLAVLGLGGLVAGRRRR
tara:strand:+ start:191550 stop:192080 length:531 start_codon:yes stop_codon:yes gene_type:complete